MLPIVLIIVVGAEGCKQRPQPRRFFSIDVARALPRLTHGEQEEVAVRRQMLVAVVAFATTVSACHKDKSQNSALEQDLNLANQRDSSARFDSLSAAERGNANAAAGTRARSTSTAPAREPVTHSGARPASSSGGGASASPGASGGASPAPAPSGGTTIQRNTKRDAAIGAGAGAVIGGATHGVKGGVVGAVVGGVLGGVIGNNVDIKKKKKKNP